MNSRRTTVPNDTHSLPLQLNVMPPPCWMPRHTLKSPYWPFQFFWEHWFEKSTNCPDHDFSPHNTLISIIITINHSHFVIHLLLVPFRIFHSSGKACMIFEFIFLPQLFSVCLNLRLTHKITTPIGIKFCGKGGMSEPHPYWRPFNYNMWIGHHDLPDMYYPIEQQLKICIHARNPWTHSPSPADSGCFFEYLSLSISPFPTETKTKTHSEIFMTELALELNSSWDSCDSVGPEKEKQFNNSFLESKTIR